MTRSPLAYIDGMPVGVHARWHPISFASGPLPFSRPLMAHEARA